MRKEMSASFSTMGKKRGMMTDVTALARNRYTVSEDMLPPSFSTMTGAAAAVGQMTQMKTPSSNSFMVGSEVRLTSSTAVKESSTRLPWRMKCQRRGRMSSIRILQNVM